MNSNTISFSFFFDQVKLSRRQHWFILAVMAIIMVATQQHGIDLFAMASLFLLTLGVTYGLSLSYHSIDRSLASIDQRTRRLKQVATGQTIFDFLVITAVIHFTGGPISPFPLMYVVSVAIISIFFSLRELISLNVVAILFYTCLMQSYRWGFISPIDITLPGQFVVTQALENYWETSYIVAMLIVGALVTSRAKKTQSGWQALDAQNAYLDRLHGLTKLGLERMDLTELHKTLSTEIRLVLGADSIYITNWDKESSPAQPEKKTNSQQQSSFASLASSKY